MCRKINSTENYRKCQKVPNILDLRNEPIVALRGNESKNVCAWKNKSEHTTKRIQKYTGQIEFREPKTLAINPNGC